MYEPIPIWTVVIIIATSLFSWRGFRDERFERKYIFDPYAILVGKQFIRIISSALLHADLWHLGFNMLSFFLFGRWIELINGPWTLLAIYFGAIIGGSLLSLLIHRQHDYRAYGASGGVCGVIFAYIFFFPDGSVSMYFLPWGIPGWLYAVIFMVGSFYALHKRDDNVGHDAHLGGAICGLVVAAVIDPDIVIESPRLFGAVSAISVLMLAYFAKFPLGVMPPMFRREMAHAHRYGTGEKPANFKVDALLDKISEHGLNSLTKKEREFLDSVSDRYRRRSESKGAESELIF